MSRKALQQTKPTDSTRLLLFRKTNIPMQTLTTQLEAQGLTNEQIQNLFLTIHGWLEENYPIMAQISKPVLREEFDLPEFGNYIIRA
jgi:hypothetical protein